ncbi:MAG: hypothetical protein PHV59_12015 [Victivallales bacterium]|nr:hypothetical protein [Victivallales bacterium]
MLLKLSLLIITGILWAGLAAVVAESSRRELNICRILPLSALFVITGIEAVCMFHDALRGDIGKIVLQMLLLTAAGAGSYFMLRCVCKAMNNGNGGVIWGITQSSMVFPFIMGLILFGEPPTSLRIIGVVTILTALFLFSCAKSDKSVGSRDWLIPALTAFVLSGISQCFSSLPSYLQLEGMTSLRRLYLTQVGIILAATADMIWQREQMRFSRDEIIAAGVFGVFNLGSLACFYYGLNLLADTGYASIGYPVGQGSSIVTFFVFNRIIYRKRASFTGFAALAVMIVGLILIAVGAAYYN